MRISDWSSDVCSSDLRLALRLFEIEPRGIELFLQLLGVAQLVLLGLPGGGQRRRLFFQVGQFLLQPVEPVLRGRVGLFLQRSEEHTSELQSLMRISYAVFCLKKKKKIKIK